MSFFGEAIDSDHQTIIIPSGKQLYLKQVCLDPQFASNAGQLSVYVKPVTKKHGVILCHVSSATPQVSISMVFDAVQSPLQLWSVGTNAMAGGVAHVTGSFEISITSSNSSSSHGAIGGDNAIISANISVAASASSAVSSSQSTKRELESSAAETNNAKKVKRSIKSTAAIEFEKSIASSSPSASSSAAPAAAGAVVVKDAADEVATTSGKKAKGKKADKARALSTGTATIEPVVNASTPSSAAVLSMERALAGNTGPTKVNLKKWNVKPQNDEGILVPEPKQKIIRLGVKAADFVLGSGVEPKLGAEVGIVYEAFFPDGTLFDQSLKRTKPFVFRKGTNQVIRGLDIGMEGMRVGGSREIVIPSELGYGKKGVADKIPPHATLMFRVTLVR